MFELRYSVKSELIAFVTQGFLDSKHEFKIIMSNIHIWSAVFGSLTGMFYSIFILTRIGMRQLFFRSVMETNGEKVMTFAVFLINTLLSFFFFWVGIVFSSPEWSVLIFFCWSGAEIHKFHFHLTLLMYHRCTAWSRIMLHCDHAAASCFQYCMSTRVILPLSKTKNMPQFFI